MHKMTESILVQLKDRKNLSITSCAKIGSKNLSVNSCAKRGSKKRLTMTLAPPFWLGVLWLIQNHVLWLVDPQDWVSIKDTAQPDPTVIYQAREFFSCFVHDLNKSLFTNHCFQITVFKLLLNPIGFSKFFTLWYLRMEQVNRDAETSAEAIQPAVPQIASRVRPFKEKKTVVEEKKEKKERKEKKESRKTATGDGRHGDPSLGLQNGIIIPDTVGDIERAVFDTAHFERELLLPLPLTPGGVKGQVPVRQVWRSVTQSPASRLLRMIGVLRCGVRWERWCRNSCLLSVLWVQTPSGVRSTDLQDLYPRIQQLFSGQCLWLVRFHNLRICCVATPESAD